MGNFGHFFLDIFKTLKRNKPVIILLFKKRMFSMVLQNLYITELPSVSGTVEQKICAVGVTKILVECKYLLENEQNQKIWYF